MTVTTAAVEAQRSRVRIFIVLMLFLVTTVNYADRATLSIAGSALSKELHLDPVALGYVFSAFGWSYVAAQVPGGWLLDRFGSKWVYACSILIWSVFTFMQGWIGFFAGGSAIVMLFALRFLVGLAEAPSFPANARIVAAWFPSNERGTASAFFNSGQYFATVLFAPLMGWIAHDFGWRYVFFVMGALGLVMGSVWIMTIHGPKDHPGVNTSEFGILVVRDAGDAVGLPHVLEELRAVPFAVEQDYKACAIAIGLEFLRGRLAGDILQETRHDIAAQGLQQTMVDRPFDGEERLALDVVDPVVGSPSQTQALS